MGKKSVVRQAIDGVQDMNYNGVRDIASAVGADGVVKTIDQEKEKGGGFAQGVLDEASGAKGKRQDAADAETGRQEEVARGVAAADRARTAAAATAKSEEERMSSGSKSRTLLTGPAGLEDEEESISRRTLRAR